MYRFKVIVVTLFLLGSSNIQSNEHRSSNIIFVERFVAAFNAKDTNAMANLVTDDIAWLSIDKSKITAEVTGKEQLVKSMATYFKSCPTCRSELAETIAMSERLSAIEYVSWQTDSGLKTQRALSVYEFSDGLISRVYYFPAEK